MKNNFTDYKKFTGITFLLVMICELSLIVPVWAVEKVDENSGKNIGRISGSASHKCYKIKSGKENKMCRLFEQNLNRFCKESSMVCVPQIHPDFAKYFSVPKWETVNYKSHIDIIAQYIRIRAIIPINCSRQCVTDTREKKWQEYKPELLQRLESGRIKFVRSHIQIKYDYDGKSKIAYRLVDTVCSPDDLENYQISRKPGLMIIDEDTGKPNEYYSIMNKYGCDSIFIYQDSAYLIDLDSLPYSPAIYSRNSIECHYDHINRNEGGKK
jgi:hypothetical protein